MAGATDIRTAIVSLLNAAGIVASGKVRDTPTTPWEDEDSEEIPCIGVYSQGTTPQRISQTSQKYRPTYRVAVQVVTEVHNETDDGPTLDAALGAALDTYETAVLNAVLGPGTIKSIDWSDSAKGSGLKDRRRGTVVVAFEVKADESYTPSAAGLLHTTITTVDTEQDDRTRTQFGWKATEVVP